MGVVARARSAVLWTLIQGWWTADLQYGERVEYCRSRGLATAMRILVGLCSCALALMPVIVQIGVVPGAPAPLTNVVGPTVGVVVGLAWAFRWWFGPMPGRVESTAFVVSSELAIVAVSWSDTDPMAGALGLATLALIAMYAAFLHSQRVLLVQVAIAAVGIATFVPPIATQFGWGLAAVKAMILLIVTIALPVVTQVLVWTMGGDAISADLDPLTGVLNRRGFLNRAAARLARAEPGEEIVAVLVDIDHFKDVNDQQGHAAGDRVLEHVARQIQRSVGPEAVVGRVGGEEFAVVDVRTGAAAEWLGDTVRAAIAQRGDHVPVTASVGVFRMPVAAIGHTGALAVESLVARADEAMYRAKRSGRDVTVVAAGGRHRLPEHAPARTA